MIKNLENTNLIRYGWQEVFPNRDIKQKIISWGSCIQLENKILLLCSFWIFLLASHATLGSRCEGHFLTLSMYSTTLSMVVISMGSDHVSRRRA